MGPRLLEKTYRDRACVISFEVNNGLSTAGDFDLVLRAETRHHYGGVSVCTCPASLVGKQSKAHL